MSRAGGAGRWARDVRQPHVEEAAVARLDRAGERRDEQRVVEAVARPLDAADTGVLALQQEILHAVGRLAGGLGQRSDVALRPQDRGHGEEVPALVVERLEPRVDHVVESELGRVGVARIDEHHPAAFLDGRAGDQEVRPHQARVQRVAAGAGSYEAQERPGRRRRTERHQQLVEPHLVEPVEDELCRPGLVAHPLERAADRR